MAVLWTWKWRRYLFNSITGRGCIERISANSLQPLPAFLQKNSSCSPTLAFNSLYYLIRHRPCYPWYRAKNLSEQRKCSRSKLRCAQQTLRSQNRVFGIHFRKRATMLSSMSLLPSFLAICPITFTTNDGIFFACVYVKWRCANPRKWPEMEDSLRLIWLSRPKRLWCSLVSCNQTYSSYSLFSLWPAVLLTSWLQPKNYCFHGLNLHSIHILAGPFASLPVPSDIWESG